MQLKIFIEKLKFKSSVGVNEWEKACKRSFVANVEILIDYKPGSDEIDETVDYASLASDIVDFASKVSCNLVEKLAYDILEFIMQKKTIVYGKLEVIKKFALLNFGSVAVTVEKTVKDSK